MLQISMTPSLPAHCALASTEERIIKKKKAFRKKEDRSSFFIINILHKADSSQK
jgi:hypothetical protein